MERFWRRTFDAAALALACAAAMGITAIVLDYQLRVESLWSGGYYADPGAGAHRTYVALAYYGGRSLGYVAVGALIALALLRPSALGVRRRFFWLLVPTIAASLLAFFRWDDVWPVVHYQATDCFPDMGHPCPNRPMLPEGWLQYQFRWVLFEAAAISFVLSFSSAVGLAIEWTVRGGRWVWRRTRSWFVTRHAV